MAENNMMDPGEDVQNSLGVPLWVVATVDVTATDVNEATDEAVDTDRDLNQNVVPNGEAGVELGDEINNDETGEQSSENQDEAGETGSDGAPVGSPEVPIVEVDDEEPVTCDEADAMDDEDEENDVDSNAADECEVQDLRTIRTAGTVKDCDQESVEMENEKNYQKSMQISSHEESDEAMEEGDESPTDEGKETRKPRRKKISVERVARFYNRGNPKEFQMLKPIDFLLPTISSGLILRPYLRENVRPSSHSLLRQEPFNQIRKINKVQPERRDWGSEPGGRGGIPWRAIPDYRHMPYKKNVAQWKKGTAFRKPNVTSFVIQTVHQDSVPLAANSQATQPLNMELQIQPVETPQPFVAPPQSGVDVIPESVSSQQELMQPEVPLENPQAQDQEVIKNDEDIYIQVSKDEDKLD